MAFFNEFPHTRTYDSDLGWLIRHVGENIESLNTLQEWAATHKEEYDDLKEKVEGLINNLVDVIVPWDSSVAYHIFSIVEYQGTNYIAVQDVPVGTMITNTDYWQQANTVVEQINAIGQTVEEVKQTADDAKEKVDKLIKLSLIDTELIYNSNIRVLQSVCYYPVNDTFIIWSANGTTGTLMEMSKDFRQILRSRVMDVSAHGSGIGYNRNNNTLCMGSALDRYAYIFNAANFDLVRSVEISEREYTNFTHLAYDEVNDRYIGWIHDDNYTVANTGFVILDSEFNLISFTSKNVQDYYRNAAGMEYTFQSMTFIDGSLYGAADFRKNPGTLYDNSYGAAISKIDTDSFEVSQTFFMSQSDYFGEMEGITKDDQGYMHFVANSQENGMFWHGIIDTKGDGSTMKSPYLVANSGANTRFKYYFNSAATNSKNLGTETDPFTEFITMANNIQLSGDVEIVLQSDLAITSWRNRNGKTTITANSHKISGEIDNMTFAVLGAEITNTFRVLDSIADFYDVTIKGQAQLKLSRSYISLNNIHLNDCTAIPILIDGNGIIEARNIDGSNNNDVLLYNNYGLIIANNVTATTSSSYGKVAGPGLKFLDNVQL